MNDDSSEQLAAQLRAVVGLDEKNSKDLATKPERANDVLSFFEKHKDCFTDSADESRSTRVLLYTTWSKQKDEGKRDFIANAIAALKLVKTQQVDAAIRYCDTVSNALSIDAAKFDEECGVDVNLSAEQISKLVLEELSQIDPKLLKANWEKSPGLVLGNLKKNKILKWADVTFLKDAIEMVVPDIIKNVPDEEVPENKFPASSLTQHINGAVKNLQKFTPMDDSKQVQGKLPISLIGDLPKVKEGTQVYIQGWAHRVRIQSRHAFIVLREGSGYVQCVFDGMIDEEKQPIHREACLAIRGTVHSEPKGAVDLQPPIEIHVECFSVIGPSDGDIENIIKPDSSLDKLLDFRHIAMRGTSVTSVMKVRHTLVKCFREHFWSKRMFEVTPPTLVQTQCEGGSTLFSLDYYGEESYLTQSSQLYLETCLPSLGSVYCILPSYRAEKSKTKRHLSEFTHVEAEYGNIKFENLLQNIQDMICDVFDRTVRECGGLIAYLNPAQLKEGCDPMNPESWSIRPKGPFRRLPYRDAIKFCNEHNIINPETSEQFKFGEDITDKPEREMIGLIGECVMMTNFPASMKSFYMERSSGTTPDMKFEDILTDSVDVLMPGIGEIVGGSMRMWHYEELMNAYKNENLDPYTYYWYTEQRKYGTCPHGGFGLGLERFLVWMLNLDSVKEACLYPRYMGRCKP